MTGFAAMGCNPDVSPDDLDEIGGNALGTEAYSSDGGKFILLQAGESITASRMCRIEPGWQAMRGDAGDGIGSMYGIPRVALANDDYGWFQVTGNALVGATAAAVTVSRNGTLSGSAGQVVTGTTTDAIAGMVYAADSGTAARNIACSLLYPKKVS